MNFTPKSCLNGLKKFLIRAMLLVAASHGLSTSALAQTFSANQLQLHFGGGYRFGGNGAETTTRTMLEFQHFSAYTYGDLFFFADVYRDHQWDGTSNRVNFYGEGYAHLSAKSLEGIPFGEESFLADIGPGIGFNAGQDFLVAIYGARASFKVPGFSVLTFGVYAYDNQIDAYGRDLDTTYQATLVWDIPFAIGDQKFSTGGVLDLIGSQGVGVEEQIYFQPEIRWDVANALGQKAGSFDLGLRYVHFNNKYGVDGVDENAMSVFVSKKF